MIEGVEVIRTAEAFDAVATEWGALFEVSPGASPPLRWEWLRTWWRIYGPVYSLKSGADEGLRIVLFRRAGELVGGIPLYLRKPRGTDRVRRLGFIGTGEATFEEIVAERLDMLRRPGDEQTCLRLFLAFLTDRTAQDWDELDLAPIPAASPLASWSATSEVQIAGVSYEPAAPCYVSDLSGGKECYLTRLSQKNRGRARRYLRDAAEVGARLDRACDGAQIEQMFNQLVSLHQARWQAIGKPGCFAAPRFLTFHRELLRESIAKGTAVIARLSMDEEPLALILGYIAGNKFDCYVTGARIGDTGPIRSPGIFALLMLQEQMIQDGVTSYDHLAGLHEYKQQFSTHLEQMVRITLERPNLRTTVRRIGKAVKSAARKTVGR